MTLVGEFQDILSEYDAVAGLADLDRSRWLLASQKTGAVDRIRIDHVSDGDGPTGVYVNDRLLNTPGCQQVY